MIRILLIIVMCLSFSGCADIPIKDGELVINQHTSATMEDAGVARINNKF